MSDDDDDRDALTYRLAQAHKMIRLGLVTLDDRGDLVPTPAMAEMVSTPIVPDRIDFDAVVDDVRLLHHMMRTRLDALASKVAAVPRTAQPNDLARLYAVYDLLGQALDVFTT